MLEHPAQERETLIPGTLHCLSECRHPKRESDSRCLPLLS